MSPSNKIRIGITGYGNLGRGAEVAISQQPDMELVAVFSRRDPSEVTSSVPAVHYDEIASWQDRIDVMLLCGGSARDLPVQTPEIARWFHTVDSYDTHAKIPEYFESVDRVARENGRLSLISTGWDPGLFSMLRLLGESVLPAGRTYTFWGKGLSQGHSDAVRRVPGVKMGVQYTLPDHSALEKIREGTEPDLQVTEMHRRICYVVLQEGADAGDVERAIKTMPDYFAPYPTSVHFITAEEFEQNHSEMPHGGRVVRSGRSGNGHHQRIEFELALESNPEFTASAMVAFARAVYRMGREGRSGAITVFDVPLGMLSPRDPAILRKELL